MSHLRVPVAPEGWPFIFPSLVVAASFAFLGWWVMAAVFASVGVACLGFFRDPERTPPGLPGAILSPADGRVVEIREQVREEFVGEAARVSIFLSPLDVHVNRSPLGALVSGVEYRPGRFLAAYRPEASETNERCAISLQGEACRVLVRQIAGVVARRVVCRVRPGDKLQIGERFGIIRFGSRTDLFLPRGVELRCRVGDRVRAGESVIGVMPCQ